MTLPYAQTVQNGNKCPHGFPIGACPICNGMGGGSMRKDRNTPRKPGEMTYNECMAAWIKIQAAKEAAIQAKIDKIESAQQRHLESRIIEGLDKAQKTLDKVLKNIESMPTAIKAPIKFIINSVISPIINIIAKIPIAINNIQMFFTNITQFISSVAEKMAMVLGEIKNFIDAKIFKKAKEAIKTFLSFFVHKEEDDKDNETEKSKLKKVKTLVKSLFKRKRTKGEEKLEKGNEY